MFSNSTRDAYRPAFAFFLLAMAVLLLLISACRPKDDTSVGPGPGPGGSWSIRLDTSSTLYVPNDTISVRLFTPEGAWAPGKLLHLESTVSPDSITAQTTTAADTLSRPWGSISPVVYWGTGDAGGQELPHESVNAFYIDLQTHDTLARASAAYRVTHR